jgi:O-antigen/teichoic acid export membrane protein
LSLELRQFSSLVLSRGLRAPLALLSGALLARLIGPDGVGQWAMVVAAATLLHSLLFNWTHAILVRFGCEERSTTGRLDVTYAMRLPMLLGASALALLALWWQPFQWPVQVFGLTGSAVGLVFGYLVAMWLMAELQSLMQVDARYAQLAYLPALTELLTACLLGAALLLTPVRSNVAMAGIVFVALAVACVAAAREWRRLGLKPSPLNARRVEEGVRFAWPLIPAFLIGYFSDWCDHLLLQMYSTSESVGLFQAAYLFMILLLSLSAPMATVLLPRLIGMNSGDPSVGRRYVERVVPTLVVLWLPVAALMVAVAPSVLLVLYGQRFSASVPVMTILCIALPASVMSTLYGLLFNLQERLARLTIYIAVMAAINVGLSMLLIPVLGVPGAAAGTAASYLASQWLYMHDQHRELGVPVTLMGTLFLIAACYSLLQALLVEDLIARLALALGFAGIVWGIARCHRMVDGTILSRLFGGRLAWLERVLTLVFARDLPFWRLN